MSRSSDRRLRIYRAIREAKRRWLKNDPIEQIVQSLAMLEPVFPRRPRPLTDLSAELRKSR